MVSIRSNLVTLVLLFMPIICNGSPGTIQSGTIPTPSTRVVLPLGDSITRGNFTTDGGYRGYLQKHMTAKGLTYDFIGPLSDNSTGVTDPDHAGYSGYRIDEIHIQLLAMGVVTAPDYVLLHAGTNDLYQLATASEAAGRLDSLIRSIAARWPDTKILVATIGPYTGAAYTQIPYMNSQINAYNAHIMALPCSHDNGEQITIVPIANMLDTQTSDGIHPTTEGYRRIARLWNQYMGG